MTQGSNTGLLRRLAAIMYDTLLVVAVLFMVTVPFIAVRGGEPVEIGDNTWYRIALVIVIYAFFIGFWTRSGRTLGMQSWDCSSKPWTAVARHWQQPACGSWPPSFHGHRSGSGSCGSFWTKTN